MSFVAGIHDLVVNENGDPFRHDTDPNMIAFMDKTKNEVVFFIETEEMKQNFPDILGNNLNMECGDVSVVDNNPHDGCNDTVPVVDNNPNEICTTGKKWTDNDATKHLIHLRRVEMKDLFQSTALSNMRKWEKLSKVLKAKKPNNSAWCFTWKQCEGKWKDLVKNYNKAKDNSGPGCSGAAPVNFKFYEDMDEVSKNSPTVKPVSVVGNITSPSVSKATSDPSEEETSDKPAPKSKLEKKVDAFVETIQANQAKRDADAERRHKENLEIQKAAIQSFETMMKGLIDKF